MLRPVNGVADHRMPERREVDANLMRASGLETQRCQRGAREPPDDPVVSHGTPSGLARMRRATPPVPAVADEVEPDRSGFLVHRSLDESHVLALDVVPSEELLQAAEDIARSREDDRSGGLLVEPMDDADVRPLFVAVQQIRVDATQESVLFTRFGRKRQEPGRLVHDDEIGIFVKHHELRPNGSDGRTIHIETDGRVLVDVAARLAARQAPDIDASRFDVVLSFAPGQGMRAGNPLIETHVRIV